MTCKIDQEISLETNGSLIEMLVDSDDFSIGDIPEEMIVSIFTRLPINTNPSDKQNNEPYDETY